MRILALDIAKRKTGWCVDSSDGAPPPRTGTFLGAEGASLGRLGETYQSWLFEVIGTWRVECVAYEAPLVAGATKADGSPFIMSEDIGLALLGLAFCTEVIAFTRKVPVVRAHVASVRKYFVGSGRPADAKRAVRARCLQLGWPVRNDDEADSCAVWAWAKATRDKGFVLAPPTPLFGKPVAA